MNILKKNDWVEVFKEGLIKHYPHAKNSPHTIETLQDNSTVLFKSTACPSGIVAKVEQDKGEIVFLKFYTTLMFNDLMAITKLQELISA